MLKSIEKVNLSSHLMPRPNFFNFFTSFAGDDDKLAVLPASTTGSLSSITTTSLVSEPGVGGDASGSDRGGDDKGEKHQLTGIKTEKWWQTTIQISIPFFIAGIGTIGAGIILGTVEVSCWRSYNRHMCSSQTNWSRVLVQNQQTVIVHKSITRFFVRTHWPHASCSTYNMRTLTRFRLGCDFAPF